MRNIIKILNDDNIEISTYVSPEARFFNPCIDIHNDYDKYESYCDFKEVINPFKMYAENERLHSIIKEVRDYILSNQNTELSVDSYFKYEDLVEFNDILRILDKDSDKE